jgi:hypothetical protein
MKEVVWKIKGIGRGMGKGTCFLYLRNGDVEHVLLSCPETKEWRIKFMDKKWLRINVEEECRK